MLINKLLARLGPVLRGRRLGLDDDAYSGPALHVVSATRLPEQTFWESSHLGVSLRRANFVTPIRHTIAFENSRGLAAVYNSALDTLADSEAAVFVHDDAALQDFFLPHRVADGLERFDLIGVAGSARPTADHAGWRVRWASGQPAATDVQPEGHALEESGAVNHLLPTHEYISRYGPVPRRVALLDGLFLAARVSTLRRSGARFDEQFRFHFYDLDFCRTCVARGLTLGTWPIALGHASRGGYNSPAWVEALDAYRAKWGVTAPQP